MKRCLGAGLCCAGLCMERRWTVPPAEAVWRQVGVYCAHEARVNLTG